jgi:hypothetical protein
VGFSGARIDEVEVSLGGGVDEDVVGAFPDVWRMEVAARTAELVNEIVQNGSRGTAGGVKAGAAETVERVDVEMVLEELRGVLGKECVAFVNEAVR